MKRIILFLSIAIFSWSNLFSQEAKIINLSADKNAIEMAENSSQKLSLQFNHKEVRSFTVETKNGLFNEITIPGAKFTGNIGDPKLPAYSELIEVPFGAQVSVEVINYTVEEYALADFGIENPVIPAQPDVRKDTRPEDVKFHYNDEAYKSKKYTAYKVADVKVLGTMRGTRIAKLAVSPVNYNPAQETIKVYNNIEVEVTFKNSNTKLTEQVKRSTFSPYFEPVYAKLLNHKNVIDDHPDLTKYPVKMMILADRMFETALEPYIEWKTKKGFEMIVNYTDEGYSTVSDIKSWVMTHYNAGTPDDPAPSFCLFVGDVAQIPASQTGTSSGEATDLYYFSQDGDYFPEMYYGRFSANNVGELQPQIDKTLYHEKYEFADPTYLDDVTLIAGADGTWNPNVGQPTVQYGTQNYFNASYGFANVNDYLTNYSGCYDNDRISVSFINYTAHCSETSWGTPNLTISDINAMTNTDKYPIAVGNCCQSSKFEYDCIGEAWVRAQDKGAVAYIGSAPSTYWFEDFYWAVGAFPIQGNNNGYVPTTTETTLGVYDAMFISDYVTVDANIFLGNLVVTEVDVQGYPQHSNPTYYWEAYNCLGDPSLAPYYTQGETNTVSHMPTLPIGVSTYEVTAEPGSYVAISKDGVLHGAALVDQTGVVDVDLDPILSGGDVDIVVTKPQYQPYITTVPAATLNGPYVVYESCQVNGGTTIEYGQTADIDITLVNVGPDDANGVTATLTTEDQYVTELTNNQDVDFGTINGDNGTSTSSGSFTVTVSDTIPDEHVISFELIASDENDSVWTSSLNITAYAPILSLNMASVDATGSAPVFVTTPVTTIDTDEEYSYNIEVQDANGNGNGRLDPGETVMLSINTGNAGHAAIMDGMCNLTTTSPYLTINTTSATVSNVPADSSAQMGFSITVDEDTEVGETVDLHLELEFDDNYTEVLDLLLKVGLIVEDFETGDFSSYAWTFGGDANWGMETTEVYEGAYSAVSGDISDDQTSSLEITLDVTTDDSISFYKKVHSEGGYDYLRFYIDGNLQDEWSGESDTWTLHGYPVTIGTHTFKWAYEKDFSVSSDFDCGWIDYVLLPPFSGAAKVTRNITITAPTLPDWLTLTDNGDGTGVVEGSTSDPGTYPVVLLADNGTDQTEQSYMLTVEGELIKENGKGDPIIIYPQPAKYTLYGESEYLIEYAELYGMQGALEFKQNIAARKFRLDLSKIKNGTYLLKMHTYDKGDFIMKVQVVK